MKLFTLFSVLVICMSTLVGCGCSTIEPGTVGIGVVARRPSLDGETEGEHDRPSVAPDPQVHVR